MEPDDDAFRNDVRRYREAVDDEARIERDRILNKAAIEMAKALRARGIAERERTKVKRAKVKRANRLAKKRRDDAAR